MSTPRQDKRVQSISQTHEKISQRFNGHLREIEERDFDDVHEELRDSEGFLLGTKLGGCFDIHFTENRFNR